jgi:hypothetical protein
LTRVNHRPPTDPHDLPPPPPFGLSTDLDPSSEIDVDLDDDRLDLPIPELDATAPERAEFVGEYPSIHDYFKALLEPEVSAACRWLLDCLDMEAVQRRFEDHGRFRYVTEGNGIYRVGILPGPPGRDPIRKIVP